MSCAGYNVVAALLAAGRRSYALLFLNNLQKAASVACGAACLARLGASGSFSVTDVITGKPHAAAELDVATGSISATVEGCDHPPRHFRPRLDPGFGVHRKSIHDADPRDGLRVLRGARRYGHSVYLRLDPK
jgi:hypothetical protein